MFISAQLIASISTSFLVVSCRQIGRYSSLFICGSDPIPSELSAYHSAIQLPSKTTSTGDSSSQLLLHPSLSCVSPSSHSSEPSNIPSPQ